MTKTYLNLKKNYNIPSWLQISKMADRQWYCFDMWSILTCTVYYTSKCYNDVTGDGPMSAILRGENFI